MKTNSIKIHIERINGRNKKEYKVNIKKKALKHGPGKIMAKSTSIKNIFMRMNWRSVAKSEWRSGASKQ